MAEGQSTTNPRWNPTREQIALLEAMYSQGIRTPKAEQIEQIADRLRMYGNIEGKNVFYWFQNRKARERQRQKQEKVGSINQFLQPPSFAGTSHTNTFLPEVLPAQQNSAIVMPKIHVTTDDNQTINADNFCEPPTLELFPLHPTGMARANPQPVQEWRNDYRSNECMDEQNDARPGGGQFYDFFHFIPRHSSK